MAAVFREELSRYRVRQQGESSPTACCPKKKKRSRKEKTLAINRDSVGTGCPANIRFRKLAGEDKVEVTYNWRHNHDTSMESRSLLPSGINELNWVKEKVSRGLDWKGVKSLLRPSEENLQSLEREEKLLLPSVLITYDNVRGAMYRKRTTNSQKASNIVTSVERWIKQIQNNGGKGLFQTNISGDPKSFLVAWCTGFQLRGRNVQSGIPDMQFRVNLKGHDKMRPLLKAMRTASSEEQLNSLWSHFKAQFPRAKKFITFIEKSWMTSEKKSKWAVFVREVSTGHREECKEKLPTHRHEQPLRKLAQDVEETPPGKRAQLEG
ncbi:hypothetical protein B0O80DRAFT_428851 [Mortierella sp. GBAus27b]|nr:hypothetical protein B0O80DRAFT_428851 [Mortierella sp. GBAus27b]